MGKAAGGRELASVGPALPQQMPRLGAPTYTTEVHLSHFRMLEAHDQGARFGASRLAMPPCARVAAGGRREAAVWGLSPRALGPSRGHALVAQSPPQGPASKCHHAGVRLPQGKRVGARTQSRQSVRQTRVHGAPSWDRRTECAVKGMNVYVRTHLLKAHGPPGQRAGRLLRRAQESLQAQGRRALEPGRAGPEQEAAIWASGEAVARGVADRPPGLKRRGPRGRIRDAEGDSEGTAETGSRRGRETRERIRARVTPTTAVGTGRAPRPGPAARARTRWA